MKTIAVIGIGRWGKNLVREFDAIARIKYALNRGDKTEAQWLKKKYPHIMYQTLYQKVLQDPQIDAVVIATPIRTHYSITKDALLAKKHVFVEKPITNNNKYAKILVALARKNKHALFVGHTFLYHPVFTKMKVINRRDPILYIHFEWEKFGSFYEHIVWNLLVHEISLLTTLWGKPTRSKLLYQKRVVSNGDIISVEFQFTKNKRAHIFINRASSIKRKAIHFITSKNAYLWENNVLLRLDHNKNKWEKIYRAKKTPLKIECKEFINTIRKKKTFPDGSFGLRVVKILSKLK